MCFIQKDKCLFYTDYSGIEIPAVINFKNIFGFQFHPEKSGKVGLILLENFKNM
jgi:glutamine amidotransferase